MGSIARAQSAEQKPLTFEVASVKRSPPDDGSFKINVVGNPQPGGRWTSRNVALVEIIRGAYPGHPLPEQVVAGPEWVRTVWFDISAKAPNTRATREDLAAMARNLLAERFKLVLRTETRDTSGYALVPARTRAHSLLRPSVLDCESIRARQVAGETIASAERSACVIRVSRDGGVSRVTTAGMELKRLVEILTSLVGAPVVDATGLTGQFDITLEFSTDSTASSEAVSLFTALEEQLGLRLERRRVSMEVLVIDHVENLKPD